MKSLEVDVWLEVGREGKVFSYKDGLNLKVSLGDIVLVKLRGRPIQGLVVAKRILEINSNSFIEGSVPKERNIHLADIEGIVQKAAVDSDWQSWVESMADRCHISSYRMLKAALPPGWLGKKKTEVKSAKSFYWIALNGDYYGDRKLPPRQQILVDTLIDIGGGAWQKEIQKRGFSISIINALLSAGRVTRTKRFLSNSLNDEVTLDESSVILEESPQTLTAEQSKAMDLFDSLPAGSAMLLWGVTGSGKTEVYLQATGKELEAGRHCLILTPEIGLIPQLVDRFKKRFGKKVFEYHSNCSVRERTKIWQKILIASEPLVLIGTRSAVFLPLSPLGLVVLDEEHDTSFKQQSPMPCYHAKDLALDRAARIGAKVILGSATPSLSTWKDLTPNGLIKVARLTHRISSRLMPTVHVVDMRRELIEGNRRLISRPLMRCLLNLKESREQAVVLVPRRGYSSFMSCRSCGEVVQCPNCDVALTVHKSMKGSHWLRCHWCDHQAAIESNCSHCGSSSFKPFGAGTQRVMEKLVEELDGLRVLRFDRDTTRGKDGHRRLLTQFSSGDADVLIGTQMLAKGMDLPRVTLAVILAADGLLYRPDLLAEEQTLQLFMQLAGRAGRGERPGKVLVQTYCPDHPVIRHLIDGSYEDFLKGEARLRREGGLVPFCRACLLRLSGESASLTSTAASAIAEEIRPICLAKGWELIGPAPSLVAKVAGRSRWQLLLHGPEKSELPIPRSLNLWDLLPRGVHLSIDTSPLEL